MLPKKITQGLPRVEELFEARKPKREAMLAEISGTISLGENKKKREMIITSDDGSMKAYPIAYGSRLKVKEGDRVVAGDELTEGQINPHDLLRILGVKAVQEHLLKEVLMVYRLQGVGIGDKHIEVIVHQMLRKVRVEDAGDTSMLPGSMVDIFHFEKENEKTIMNGGRPAVAKRILLGITSVARYRVLPLRRPLPGDDPRAHRSRDQGQGRSARRPQGERNPRQAHPGRQRVALQAMSKSRNTITNSACQCLSAHLLLTFCLVPTYLQYASLHLASSEQKI